MKVHPRSRPGGLWQSRLVLIAGIMLVPLLWSMQADAYQGFGATTSGGSGKKRVRVTTLNDAGAGSFRQAVSQGNRTIVFDVAGEIELSSPILVRGAFITIDGFSAPSPGITLRHYGLFMRGDLGAHDVIVRGIRVRNSQNDGILIKSGAYNVVIDHVSIDGSADGNLNITDGAHDITVSWSILGNPAWTHPTNMLIKQNPSRVTLHHNLFRARERNPQVRIDAAGTPATATTLDMRNNVIWGWGSGYGTLIFFGPWANVVQNYYYSAGGDAGDALVACKNAQCRFGQPVNHPNSRSRAYVEGNVSGDGLDTINNEGAEPQAFSAPVVDTQGACAAAAAVLAGAGVRPLDDIDKQYILATLPGC